MDNRGGKKHFEFLISIIVISLVSLVFFVWVERLAMDVEKSKIQYTLSNMRSAIKIYELTTVVTGDSVGLLQQHHANPVALMGVPPALYVGEFSDARQIKKGTWYFDSIQNEIVYLVKYLDSNPNRADQLRFQLKYKKSLVNGLGRLKLVERAIRVDE